MGSAKSQTPLKSNILANELIICVLFSGDLSSLTISAPPSFSLFLAPTSIPLLTTYVSVSSLPPLPSALPEPKTSVSLSQTFSGLLTSLLESENKNKACSQLTKIPVVVLQRQEKKLYYYCHKSLVN